MQTALMNTNSAVISSCDRSLMFHVIQVLNTKMKYGETNHRLVPMRLEWTVYAFTSGLFLTIGMLIYLFNASPEVGAFVFAVLTVLYAWVAWVMIKRKAVLELHAYEPCPSCGALTPAQGSHCMNCGASIAGSVSALTNVQADQ